MKRLGAGLAILSAIPLGATPATAFQGGPPDLARYAGRYPFDRIGGVRFLSHPIVRQAVANAAPSAAIRNRILAQGTSGDIVVTPEMVLAWACEPHNCGPHNWSIAIGRRNQAHFVCYQPDGTESGRWYRRRRLVAETEGGCPFEAANVPRAVLDAL